MGETRRSSARLLPSLLIRTGVLVLTWWILSGGDRTSLMLGLPISFLASVLSVLLAPPHPTGLRLAGVLPYAGYFVFRSIAGGLDVARRALSPSMPIDPALIHYRVSLTGTAPRVVFANTVSLLPGTLSARIDGESLQVHALDASPSIHADLRSIEVRVAALYGQRLIDVVRA